MKISIIFNKCLTVVLTLILLLSVVMPAMAKEGSVAGKNIPIATSQGLGPTDRAEMESFMDSLLAKEMEEYHIAGAAVSVVKDGKLFFAKGYGYADVAKHIPVDPEKTIFRIGSVGKVFTWTAVMQLVEQGKLDLDADINTYLDFHIPDTYPQPITLKNLMTHTSGFEDRWFGSAVPDTTNLVPAGKWLSSPVWKRVHPPGYAGYSNYNAMLAGYIVARVSGEPYDQYMQEHIFDPLGMVHSTASSVIPPNMRPYASLGYTYADGAFQAFPDYTAQPALLASGGQRLSVTDMARFMIARLDGGRYSDENIGEARILEESTAQQMLGPLYTPDPRLRGTAYGFFDFSDNGQEALGHTGYSPPMHSILLLLPDQNLGVFVNYNSDGGGEPTGQHAGFQRAFFDHYYPASTGTPPQSPADFTARADRFVGSYNAYSSYTTLVKIAGLFGSGYTVNISNPGDGTLHFSLEGLERQFVEVKPLYFHQVDGPFSMVFHEDNRGRITGLSTDLMPQYAVRKLGWYETQSFNMRLLLGCFLIFLSIIPVGLIRLIQDRLSRNRKPASRGTRVAYWMVVGICVLNLLFRVCSKMTLPGVMQF
jgi:CubicO group peptidase (beta-lactamase class C family)